MPKIEGHFSLYQRPLAMVERLTVKEEMSAVVGKNSCGIKNSNNHKIFLREEFLISYFKTYNTYNTYKNSMSSSNTFGT